MLLIALSPAYDAAHTDNSISTKMAGVILASLSSGGGELSFLGLTHFYGPFSLAAWGSGTGAAGLVGAGAYALATTSLGFSVKSSLLVSATLPIVMLLSFFVLLPQGPLRYLAKTRAGYKALLEREEEEGVAGSAGGERRNSTDAFSRENEGLLGPPPADPNVATKVSGTEKGEISWGHFQANLKRAKKLFFPL